MNPRIDRGWLVVDCDAPDTAKVTIAIEGPRMAFAPAFRDYDRDVRTAKIRVPDVHGKVRVLVEINGERRTAGAISL